MSPRTPNTAVITLWAESLESGEYQQAAGALKSAIEGGDGDGYCCLGVLCELAVKEGVIGPPTRRVDGAEEWSYGGAHLGLPSVVSEWAGFYSCDPLLRDPDQPVSRYGDDDRWEGSASHFNDSQRMTFPQIARLIRHTFLDDD